MTVYIWLYTSTETRPLGPEDILDILNVSRRHNAAAGITGMLIHNGNRFTQVIEGDEAAITALKAKIEADPRHRDVETLAEGPRGPRIFAHWSMAFHEPTAAEAAELQSFLPLNWATRTLRSVDDNDPALTRLLARMADWVSNAA